jgi:hypothetical protein
MITELTAEQFTHLPGISQNYPCDRCGKKYKTGYLKRALSDYTLVDGELLEKETYTALYLCEVCMEQAIRDHRILEQERSNQIQQIMSNEARWLQHISHLSIQELSEKVGVSRQSYHKWLRGKAITEEHKMRLKELIATYMRGEQ